MRQSFWKKRVRLDTGLSAGAKHLANCLADLHADAGAKHTSEGVGITLDALCSATGWKAMNTIRKYRDELVAAGWVQWRPVHRDHRQRPTIYLLTETQGRLFPDPREDESRVQAVHPESRVQEVHGLNPAPDESRVQTPSVSRVQTFEPRSTKYLLEEVAHEPRSGELVSDDDDTPANEPPPDISQLLDDLGIIRRKKA